MRAHLQTCANCKARLEEEQDLSRLLKRSRPLYSAPRQLCARVSAIEKNLPRFPHEETGGTVDFELESAGTRHSSARDRTCSQFQTSRRRCAPPAMWRRL
jgi:hypothetical protein